MLPLGDDYEWMTETLEFLYSVEGYPREETKDVPMIRDLQRQYPEIDMREAALGWSLWMSEHRQKKKIKYRSRFRNWVKNADRFAKERSRKVARHRGPENEGHGDDVGATRSW